MIAEIEKVKWKNKNYVEIGKYLLLTEEEYNRAIGRMIRFHKDMLEND
jgi:hypothetical protein